MATERHDELACPLSQKMTNIKMCYCGHKLFTLAGRSIAAWSIIPPEGGKDYLPRAERLNSCSQSRRSYIHLRIVVPEVAGSNPVFHPNPKPLLPQYLTEQTYKMLGIPFTAFQIMSNDICPKLGTQIPASEIDY